MLDEVVEDWTDGRGSKSKLSQAVSQRWRSIEQMLFRLLGRWDALNQVYVQKGVPFPLANKKNEVSFCI